MEDSIEGKDQTEPSEKAEDLKVEQKVPDGHDRANLDTNGIYPEATEGNYTNNLKGNSKPQITYNKPLGDDNSRSADQEEQKKTKKSPILIISIIIIVILLAISAYFIFIRK